MLYFKEKVNQNGHQISGHVHNKNIISQIRRWRNTMFVAFLFIVVVDVFSPTTLQRLFLLNAQH